MLGTYQVNVNHSSWQLDDKHPKLFQQDGIILQQGKVMQW